MKKVLFQRNELFRRISKGSQELRKVSGLRIAWVASSWWSGFSSIVEDRNSASRGGRCFCALVLSMVCLFVDNGCFAQATKKAKLPGKAPEKKAQKAQPTLADRMRKARAELVAAANEYKASLEKLLALQNSDVKMASETVEKRKVLLEQSVISKRELEESQRELAAAQDKVNETKKQIGESDNLIAEARMEEQVEKLGSGIYQTSAALIRYNGPATWVLTDAGKVQSFFAMRFNHALPISAFGQTPVHDHLGFDHHNSMDVAVTPDSAEGQALMSYLRGLGIPFIAFRQAVRGSATGAHIHIGYPSKRIAR